jgi:GrpB-like predicted nucleotidyltransferase (UPF0157 family)
LETPEPSLYCTLEPMPAPDATQSGYRPGGPIVLVPHDARWFSEFERESAAVATALGDTLVELHHIGSTAIPAIVAKPVIDMLAVVRDLGLVDVRAPALELLSYEAMGEFGIKGRRYFRKNDSDGVRTHQVHAFVVGSPDVHRHLAFRDYLRSHPAEAQRYSELKLALAQRNVANIDSYTDGKTTFVREIEARALHGAQPERSA